MKDIVYPAVLYKDKDSGWYTIAIHDVGIITEGDSVESAFLKAKEYLYALCECAIKFECRLDDASKFNDVYNSHKNNIVILVDARLE